VKKKLRKFSEGGYEGDDSIVKYRMGVTETPKDYYKDNAPYKSDDQGVGPAPLRQSALFTNMGKNEAIDSDTRSRALKFAKDASEESRDLGVPVTPAAPKSTSSVSKTVAPPIKPVMDMEAEKARMEDLTKKQALIPVNPEDYIPGAGMLKPLLRKVAEMGAKRTAKEVAAKNVMRKAEEGFNPKEALEKINPTKVHNVAGRKIPVKRTMRKSKSTEGMADDGGSGAFKHGGSVSKSDMKKAGFYDKDKTKSERQAIVSKVTTKPQRVAMVEKVFSSKNMKAGGMASRRADGCAIRGKTRA